MKLNSQKNKKEHLELLKFLSGQRKEILPFWRIVDFQPNDLSVLESMHRVSWRRYVSSIAMIFLISGSCVFIGLMKGRPAWASTTKEDSGLASNEGELKIEDIKPLNEDGEELKEDAAIAAKAKESHFVSVEKKRPAKPAASDLLGPQPKKGYKPKIYMAPLDPDDAKMKGIVKSVTGKMTVKNTNGLAVEYQVDKATHTPREMWLNFVGGMEVAKAKSMDEIQPGDTVKVTYKMPKDESRKILTKVELVKHKPVQVDESTASGTKEASSFLMDKNL